MYNEEPAARRFYAIGLDEDIPTTDKGRLIPSDAMLYRPPSAVAVLATNPRTGRQYWVVFMLTLALLVMAGGFGAVRFGVTPDMVLATIARATTPVPPPVIVVEHPYTNEQQFLNYGVNVTLSEPYFFDNIRDRFIDEGTSFLEVHLTTMQLRYFKDGVLTEQIPILAKGERGSWGEVPAGLYQAGTKARSHFSIIGQVYLPWHITFQGNYAIHGIPFYESGEVVDDEYLGGGIRIANRHAERLFSIITPNTPILVHDLQFRPDTFVYEPKIPEIDTPHYLIADIESSTVLASSDLDTPAPIASITKLMTALVAAETINLDQNVWVTEPTFVQSLIPRLQDRLKVSMYSLLQLLIIESSNEAAEVIAAQIGRAEFVAAMNARAASLGMENTTFVDPSGIEAGNQSTIRDLLRLTQYIYTTRPFIFELSANQHLKTAYTGGEFGTLTNFNLIADVDNFVGGKIGETTAAGQTSVSLHRLSVKGQQRTLAVIILGSDSRSADIRDLLGYAEARFGTAPVSNPSDVN